MPTETRFEKYDWDKHFADFSKRYLDDSFSLITINTEVRRKNRNYDSYINLDLKGVPGFISEEVLAIKVRLGEIYMQEREEIVGTLVRRQLVEVADLSGIVEYNRILYHERRWSMSMIVGQTIYASNMRDLYKIVDGNVPVFQLKKIDRYKKLVTIGPRN